MHGGSRAEGSKGASLRKEADTETWYGTTGPGGEAAKQKPLVVEPPPVLLPFLVSIVVLAALVLSKDSTRTGAFFSKKAEIGFGNPHALWVGLATAESRFGWRKFCFRGAGLMHCSNYESLDTDSKHADSMHILGSMTYSGQVISLTLAALLLLWLAVARSYGGISKQGRTMTTAIASLMAAFLLSVTVIAFPVVGMQLLRDLGVKHATLFQAGWAWWCCVAEALGWAAIATAAALAPDVDHASMLEDL